MVVLVITTLVVSTALAVITLVRKQTQIISFNYETATSYRQLEKSLWIDFYSFEKITFNSDERKLYFTNQPDQQTIYQFERDFTLKNDDTLAAVKELELFSEGLPVKTGKLDAIRIMSDNYWFFIYFDTDAAYNLNN